MGRKSYHITQAMLELSDHLLALMYSLDLSLFLSKQFRMLFLQVVFDLMYSICSDDHFLSQTLSSLTLIFPVISERIPLILDISNSSSVHAFSMCLIKKVWVWVWGLKFNARAQKKGLNQYVLIFFRTTQLYQILRQGHSKLPHPRS